MSKLALGLIEKEKRRRTGRLDLGRCGLTVLPEELFELVWLEELSICNRYWDYKHDKWIDSINKGKANFFNDNLPQKILNLKQLQVFHANGDIDLLFGFNNISILSGLKKLERLDLSYNKICLLYTSPSPRDRG